MTLATFANRPSAPRIVLAAVLLAVAAVYARTAWNEFAYDDRVYVMSPLDEGPVNRMVDRWQGVTEYFTSFYGRGILAEGRGLRPVTVMSYALVHMLFDQPGQPVRPGAQHLANVLLHVLATFLVYLLIRRFFPSAWPAVGGAAIFGLHALRSDAVISVVGRAEILAFVFGLTGLLLYLRAMHHRGGLRIATLGLAGSALFLAFSSKESALVWAVFVPLCSVVHRGGRVRDELLPFTVAVLVPAFGFLILWAPVISGSSFEVDAVFNPLATESGPVRFYSAVMVLGHAATQALWPFGLRIDYGFNTFELVEHWHDYRFLVPFALLLTALLAGTARIARNPVLFLAVAMFFGFTFVTSNIPILVETIYAERLMYTPATAVSLIGAWTLHRWWRLDSRLPGRIALGACVVWIGISCVVINGRCRVWRNNETLFVHEAIANPRSMVLQAYAAGQHRARAEAVGFRGDAGAAHLADMKLYLDRALAVHQRIRRPEALNDLANFHLIKSELHVAANETEAAARERAIAEGQLRDALASPLLQRMTANRIHRQLAQIFAIQDDHAAQRIHLQQALECEPHAAQSYRELAEWESRHGTPRQAIAILAEGLEKLPDMLAMRAAAMDLAWAADDGTAYAAFLADGERLHGTTDPILQTYRALLLGRERQYAKAVQLFEASVHRLPITPPWPVFAILPKALAEVGRTSDALEFLRQHQSRPGLPASIGTAMRKLAMELQRKRP